MTPDKIPIGSYCAYPREGRYNSGLYIKMSGDKVRYIGMLYYDAHIVYYRDNMQFITRISKETELNIIIII